MIELIEQDDELVVTEPVRAEVLMGSRTAAKERELRQLLARCPNLPFDVRRDFEAAVFIYRECRDIGVTPRGLVDCMIAAVAWRAGATLLARDVDLERIAAVIGIALDLASVEP